jgi:hypothetical protein
MNIILNIPVQISLVDYYLNFRVSKDNVWNQEAEVKSDSSLQVIIHPVNPEPIVIKNIMNKVEDKLSLIRG